ncbi:hypothetical protein DRN67_02760 [Candidatus Micrarchaeota archaeon]|nr:MAG: hypothetical protein DRN67_02760 [Candidatus Micrarchaeota archaeon]
MHICNILCSAESAQGATGLPGSAPNVQVSSCASIIGLTPKDILPGQKVTIKSILGPSPSTPCKDAAGRDNAFEVGDRYAGKLYIQYHFPGDDPDSKARILTADIVATVQAG